MLGLLAGRIEVLLGFRCHRVAGFSRSPQDRSERGCEGIAATESPTGKLTW